MTISLSYFCSHVMVQYSVDIESNLMWNFLNNNQFKASNLPLPNRTTGCLREGEREQIKHCQCIEHMIDSYKLPLPNRTTGERDV